MKLKGKALILGDNINTDFIISGRYKFSITDIKELSKHIMEDIDPNFYSKIIPSISILVCGRNFGMGSSREQAPEIIKALGIHCIVAKSFARIFYRNAINNGLLVIENSAIYDKVQEGETLTIDTGNNAIMTAHPERICFGRIPEMLIDMINSGGLVEYYRARNRSVETQLWQ